MNRRPIPRVPRLLPGDIADDSRLGGVIDRVITAERQLHDGSPLGSSRHQDRLQRLCDDDAWVEYLHVEEATNDRVNMMLALVARWAFEEGRRQQRRR